MQRIIVNMQSYLMGEAIEKALKASGDFQVTTVEKAEDVVTQCSNLVPNILLMEVTGYEEWRLEARMKICSSVKKIIKSCRIVLLVDENAEKQAAAQIKQYKMDGLIDQFVYASTSASYLAALIETL